MMICNQVFQDEHQELKNIRYSTTTKLILNTRKIKKF